MDQNVLTTVQVINWQLSDFSKISLVMVRAWTLLFQIETQNSWYICSSYSVYINK